MAENCFTFYKQKFSTCIYLIQFVNLITTLFDHLYKFLYIFGCCIIFDNILFNLKSKLFLQCTCFNFQDKAHKRITYWQSGDKNKRK